MGFRIAFVATIFLSVAFAARAEVALDVLDNCDAMTSILNMTDADVADCHSASTALGKVLAGRLQPQACYFELALDSARTFECVQVHDNSLITCFRATRGNPVSEIMRSFEHGGDKLLSDYLSRANACPFSNGRASPAPATTIAPSPLGWIAKADFTLGVEVGPRDGSVGRGAVFHGFGATDPALDGAPPHIEFVLAFKGECRGPSCLPPDTSGDEPILERDGLAVTRSTSDAFVKQWNDQARRALSPARIAAVTYRLTFSDNDALTLQDVVRSEAQAASRRDQTRQIVEKWVAKGRSAVGSEGLREPTQEEWRQIGSSSDQIVKDMLQGMPYALRGDWSEAKALVLGKIQGAGCFRNGAVYLVILYTDGQLNVIGFGLGDCKYHADEYIKKFTESVESEDW